MKDPIKNFLKPTIPEASRRGISPVPSRLSSGTEILYFTSPGTAENGSFDLSQGEVNRKPRPKGRRIFRFNVYTPEGFRNVNSYLFVAHPQEEIDFLKKAFLAEEINRSIGVNGEISNCILKIGDSCFMISQARGEFENMRTAFYLYVNDVDTVCKHAMEAGAKESFPPEDMDYQDRQGGIIDPSGNYWFISKRLVEKGYHE